MSTSNGCRDSTKYDNDESAGVLKAANHVSCTFRSDRHCFTCGNDVLPPVEWDCTMLSLLKSRIMWREPILAIELSVADIILLTY